MLDGGEFERHSYGGRRRESANHCPLHAGNADRTHPHPGETRLV